MAAASSASRARWRSRSNSRVRLRLAPALVAFQLARLFFVSRPLAFLFTLAFDAFALLFLFAGALLVFFSLRARVPAP